MKSEILRILRETSGYVSGQELCETLGVSRTAVWKAVKQLKEKGYTIEAVQNRGYHMVESPDVLSASEIESRLETEWLGRPIIYADEADSTNTWLKRLAEEGAAEGTVTVADFQNHGKGRRGKMWQAPQGTTIAMTILLRPDLLPEQASMLTIVMGLSVAQAIRETTELDACIKWPNDVVLSNKKLCGILTEMSTQVTDIDYVISGVGINVNTLEFPDELKKIATSLAIESGQLVRRAPLAAAVLKSFEKNYDKFMDTRDLTGIILDYNELLINQGKQIRVIQSKDSYVGTSHGINNKGELLVEKEDHSITTVFAGEVSVRGLYGYVD